jgi:hypothetical protein
MNLLITSEKLREGDGEDDDLVGHYLEENEWISRF